MRDLAFIKLCVDRRHPGGNIYLRASAIEQISECTIDNKTGSEIVTTTGRFIFVTDTHEDILRKLYASA